MTSKNIDRFKVTVCNCQIIDGERDIICETGIGSFRIDNKKVYLMYKPEGTTVMIKLSDGTASVKRLGENSSDIKYTVGKRTELSYKTPYGIIDMQIDTKKAEFSGDASGGVISLVYDIYTGGAEIENIMEIKIEKRKD